MSGALRFLVVRSARHRAAAQLRRLAEPRYLVAAGLGLAYLASLFARPPRAQLTSASVSDIALIAGSAGLAAWTAWVWTLGRGSRLVGFSPPELTFLAAGPIGTTRLLLYKLARGQLAIVVNAVLWTLLLGWSGAGLAAWRELPAVWMLLTTVQLHHLGATLARREDPAAGERRWRVEWTALVAIAALLTLAVTRMWPPLRAGWSAGIDELLPAARIALEQPLVATLLAPFRIAVAPLAAPSVADWLAALPGAALLLALHVAWILAVRERFRRTAAESPGQGAGASRRLAWSAPLAGLSPTGTAALAVTWKNVTAVARRRRAAVLTAGAAGVALTAVLSGRLLGPIVPQSIVAVAAVWAGAFALLGPQWVRNDLRTDLRHLDWVRSWPLPGAAIVAAEVLASTLVLTALQFGLLAIAGVAAVASGALAVDAGTAAAIAAGIVALPLVNGMHLLVHNALAVLYPGWVALGPEPRAGIEGLGQQAIVLIAGLGGLMLLLLPWTIAASLAWTAADAFGITGRVTQAAAALITAPVALATSAALVRWLGERIERLEPGDLDAGAERAHARG